MVDLEVLPDADAVAAAGARRIAEVAEARGHIALAGGSSPKRAYELLTDDLARASLWFSDDRAVPPDDPRSNLAIVPEPLRDRVHRIEGELEPQVAADRYEARIRAELGREPVFDLVLLGLGPDAHCASLFPGKPAVEERERLVVAVLEAGMEPFVPRVTFTLPLINAAREVLFMVTGTDKAPAVARAFGEPPDPSSPAARVRPVHVLLDDAAAAELRGR